MLSAGYKKGFFFRKYGVALTVLLFLTAFFSAYAYLTTPSSVQKTRIVTQNLYSWEGRISGMGIVSESNPLWPEGSLVFLPLYPQDLFSKSKLEFSFNVSGKEVNLTLTRTFKVVYYIAYDENRIFESTYTSLVKSESGRGFRETITLNVTDLYRELEAMRSYLRLPKEEIGVDLVGEVRYSGKIDGVSVKGNQTFRGEINFPYPGFYSIKGDSKNSTVTTSREVLYTVEVNQKRRTVYKATAIASSVVGLLSLVLWVSARKTKIPEDIMEYLEQRKRLEKWISRGHLENFIPYAKIRMETLKDLVDSAIDMDERVVHDESSDMFFFIKEGIMYYYTIPEDQMEEPKH